jgi:magnesium transporter
MSKHPFDHVGVVARPEARQPGAPPGLLVAPEGSPLPVIDAMVSGNGRWQRFAAVTVDEVAARWAARAEGEWIWVDVNGLGDASVVAAIGKIFGFHRLSLEDTLHLRQRPKYEDYEDYDYMVLQVPFLGEDGLDFEQVSLFFGEHFVVTFQAYETNRLAALVDRMSRGASRINASGTDYLAYAALDVLVDWAFPVLEHFDDRIESMEERLLERHKRRLVAEIHHLRVEVSSLRRVCWSLRQVPEAFLQADSPWIKDDTRPYLRDVKDHVQRILDVSEQQNHACSGLFDLHLSVSGTELNEVMKVLTVLSTFFLPLMTIAGIYGMNFDPDASPWNMPELRWAFGYPFSLGLMLVSCLGLFWMFKRKRWF